MSSASDETAAFKSPVSYKPHPARIPLEGTDNFRDLGGYRTADGQTLRKGLVYRSGHLGKLTDGDLARLKELGIRQVVDFRGSVEKEQDVNRLPEGVEYVERPVDVAGADMQAEFRAFLAGRGRMKVENYLVDVNRKFVREYPQVFAGWLQDLARNPGAVPQVFHCTAGKDRTGFAAAIFLRILGVDEKTVMADYLLSRELMAESIEGILKYVRKRYPLPGLGRRLRPMLGVDEAFLGTAFETITEDWGGFDAFVTGGLGLSDKDLSALKNRFLG